MGFACAVISSLAPAPCMAATIPGPLSSTASKGLGVVLRAAAAVEEQVRRRRKWVFPLRLPKSQLLLEGNLVRSSVSRVYLIMTSTNRSGEAISDIFHTVHRSSRRAARRVRRRRRGGTTSDTGAAADVTPLSDVARPDATPPDANRPDSSPPDVTLPDATPPDAGCTVGTASCPCAASNTCDEGLRCDRGFCVIDDLPDGRPDVTLPDAGPPLCPPDQAGCPCDHGACGGGLRCEGGVCVVDACPAGQLDCPCAAGACDGEWVCQEDVCRVGPPPPDDGLRVDGANAKGCDALFGENGTRVARVAFARGITGQYMRRDGKVAVSFISAAGENIVNVGTIVLDDGQAAAAGDLEPIRSTCYDATGHDIDGARVVLP